MYLIYFFAYLLLSLPSWANTSPAQLASVFNDSHQIKNYLVSEKYDGVRAIWNGQHSNKTLSSAVKNLNKSNNII